MGCGLPARVHERGKRPVDHSHDRQVGRQRNVSRRHQLTPVFPLFGFIHLGGRNRRSVVTPSLRWQAGNHRGSVRRLARGKHPDRERLQRTTDLHDEDRRYQPPLLPDAKRRVSHAGDVQGLLSGQFHRLLPRHQHAAARTGASIRCDPRLERRRHFQRVGYEHVELEPVVVPDRHLQHGVQLRQRPDRPLRHFRIQQHSAESHRQPHPRLRDGEHAQALHLRRNRHTQRCDETHQIRRRRAHTDRHARLHRSHPRRRGRARCQRLADKQLRHRPRRRLAGRRDFRHRRNRKRSRHPTARVCIPGQRS